MRWALFGRGPSDVREIVVNGLVVSVVRKRIRNMSLRVYPPDGTVSVSAPLRVSDDAVRTAVVERWDWIRRQQNRVASLERPEAKEFVTGEEHLYLGQKFRLNVNFSSRAGEAVWREDGTLDLTVKTGASRKDREKALLGWYRARLKELIPPLMAQWEGVMGVEVMEWGVKSMKTKWGTCNTRARRIWINLELAKKPVRCLEYILVHELTHLLEKSHNHRFKSFMDRFLPQWRAVRTELKESGCGE